MILSSALDNGDIFMCLVAILTSVVSAVYYLYIVKNMFFEKSKHNIIMNNNTIKNKNSYFTLQGENNISNSNNNITAIMLSNSLTSIVSILSLMILLFIFLYYEIYFLMNIISILLVY
jgi:NADH-ubiquinone oxidoreductase chain 2